MRGFYDCIRTRNCDTIQNRECVITTSYWDHPCHHAGLSLPQVSLMGNPLTSISTCKCDGVLSIAHKWDYYFHESCQWPPAHECVQCTYTVGCRTVGVWPLGCYYKGPRRGVLFTAHAASGFPSSRPPSSATYRLPCPALFGERNIVGKQLEGKGDLQFLCQSWTSFTNSICNNYRRLKKIYNYSPHI